MPYVRQHSGPEHKCAPPGLLDFWLIETGGPYLYEGTGKLGDLWRCDVCEKLYRLGLACNMCEYYGNPNHGGQCVVGYEWLPATFWQRFLYRNR